MKAYHTSDTRNTEIYQTSGEKQNISLVILDRFCSLCYTFNTPVTFNIHLIRAVHSVNFKGGGRSPPGEEQRPCDNCKETLKLLPPCWVCRAQPAPTHGFKAPAKFRGGVFSWDFWGYPADAPSPSTLRLLFLRTADSFAR